MDCGLQSVPYDRKKRITQQHNLTDKQKNKRKNKLLYFTVYLSYLCKMHLTIKLLTNKHPTFIARTVFVKNNNVDDACRLVNRILGKEGILEQYRLTRYYEKPFQVTKEHLAFIAQLACNCVGTYLPVNAPLMEEKYTFLFVISFKINETSLFKVVLLCKILRSGQVRKYQIYCQKRDCMGVQAAFY